MAKQLLNEAELLLLKHWDEAHLLETSMERVREKYNGLFEHVVEEVMQAHPSLNANRIYVNQVSSGNGWIALARKSWPDVEVYSLPGLFLGNLRLEVLTAEEEPPPTATIWVPPKTFKKIGSSMAAAKEHLLSTAHQVLSKDEFEQHVRPEGSGKALLSFGMPSKKEVLELFATDEGGGLVEALVARIDVMARFVPALDALFGQNPSGG